VQSHQTSTTQVYIPKRNYTFKLSKANYYYSRYQLLTLDFSLRRSFYWMFVIVDAQTFVLGADLLGLLGRCATYMPFWWSIALKDPRNSLCSIFTLSILYGKTISAAFYALILLELSQPQFGDQPVNHDITCHIVTNQIMNSPSLSKVPWTYVAAEYLWSMFKQLVLPSAHGSLFEPNSTIV